MDDESKIQSPSLDGLSQPTYNARSGKISVFISSSMRDEDGFSWAALRKEISDLLRRSSDLFQPFAIEEHASFLPSRQFYLAKVKQCDVLVSLIKGRLRPGTREEIQCAIEHEKPLMLIMIGDEQDEEAEELVRYIHGIDYATTHKHPSVDGLPEFILDELNDAAVMQFKSRAYRMNLGSMPNVVMGDIVNHSVPRDAIAAFGDSATLLAGRYDYDVNWIKPENSNPYLAPLGSAAVSWLVDGEPFDVLAFLPTIKVAMSDSGVSNKTLELRLKALDAFVKKDYGEAFSYARLASESVAQKESWLYGNCLIDERNMADYSPNEGLSASLAVQNRISELKTPVVFPLAAKYESSAAQQILKTARKYRTLSPRSTVFDSTLASVLYDLCQLLFSAVLYGSIATFSHTRILVANALLDYSEVYSDETLAYEGVRLLILAGDARAFSKHYRSGIDSLSNSLKINADSLWHLSKLGIEKGVPRMRCALASEAVPYFSDDVFLEVEEYLANETGRFRHCRSEWLGAINSIKLRMDQAKLAELLSDTVNERLYLTADKVGAIIAGSRLAEFPKDKLIKLANAMKDHSSELIENNIPYRAFAAIEKESGVVVLGRDQLEAVDDVSKGLYLDRDDDDTATELACIDDLLSQYETNNVAGRHVEFAYHPVPAISGALSKGLSSSIAQALEPVLDKILATIGEYRGCLSSLDDPMAVLCKYASVLRSDGVALKDEWIERISAMPENHPTASGPAMFDRYSVDAWRARRRALRVAAGIEDGLDFLVDGVSFGSYSFEAKLAYSESLVWLVGSGLVNGSYKVLARKVCDAIACASEYQVRAKAPHCYSAYSKSWGAAGLEDALYSLAADPSSVVVYELLRVCKNGSFGDPDLESEIIEALSRDANWFIRWHAEHDK